MLTLPWWLEWWRQRKTLKTDPRRRSVLDRLRGQR